MVGCPHEVAVGGILAGPGLRGDDPLLRLTHRGGGAAEQLPLFSFGVEDVAVPVRGQLLSGTETDADEQAAVTKYIYNGDILAGEIRDDGKSLLFYYDNNGQPFGLRYNGTDYYYLRNLQNDVAAIADGTGAIAARYYYDAWGNLLSVTDGAGQAVTDAEHIGLVNPIRYRGYYYDSDTGYYWLQSRYYSAQLQRFINADTTEILDAKGDLYDKNLFSYCDNNPVVRVDHGGAFWDTIFDVVSLVTSVAEVIANPTSVSAWAGLAADVVCLVTPGVTGGGTVVKAVSKAGDVAGAVKTVNKVDNAVGAAKTAKKVHGNSLKTTKETIGYALKKMDTGEIMKYGETTRGVKRYSQRFYRENGVKMVEMARGSKYDMHYWQHNQIVSYYNQYGHRPPWNKSFW